MPSLEDIHFDDFYKQPSSWTFLLYQVDGVNLYISLPNAQLMSFVQVFDNRQRCRDIILESIKKMVTLFIYSENVERWWAAYKDDTPHNLQQIHIFCNEPQDELWMNTYTGRFKSRIKDRFLCDQLDSKILYYAIGFIDKIKPEFQGVMLAGLQAVRQSLCAALSRHFDEESRR